MAAPQFSTSGTKPSKREGVSPSNLPIKRSPGHPNRSRHRQYPRTRHPASGQARRIHRRESALQSQLDSALEQLQDYVDELGSIGVELKDYESGLIDFPGRHQGRDIYLCWKLGEEKVTHWHELHSGYAGRQSTNTLEEEE
jgi:hypothetical protein